MLSIIFSYLLTLSIFLLFSFITYLSQIPACITLACFFNIYEKYNRKTKTGEKTILIFEIIFTFMFGILNTALILFLF